VPGGGPPHGGREDPGKIITISSGAHNSGRKGAAHYCASKAGVVMFTKVLAMELGPHQSTSTASRRDRPHLPAVQPHDIANRAAPPLT
jgi:NAD(P)-dependent dehydrogenase (short-subunit alcohol dehydrogenase family)